MISDDAIWMSYDLFDGDRGYNIGIDNKCAIRVKIETISGELSIEISADGKSSDYSGRISNDQEFTVYLNPGDYHIHLDASKHSGKFSFEIMDTETQGS